MLQSIAFLAFALVARRAFAFNHHHHHRHHCCIQVQVKALFHHDGFRYIQVHPRIVDSSPILPTRALPPISQVDVLYGSRTSLVYDAALERYVPATNSINSPSQRFLSGYYHSIQQQQQQQEQCLDTHMATQYSDSTPTFVFTRRSHSLLLSIHCMAHHSTISQCQCPRLWYHFSINGIGSQKSQSRLDGSPQLGSQGCPGQDCENDVGGKHGTQV